MVVDVGMLEYYLLEDRSGKCRGSNHMGKATVIPSQDDENTFTINFVSGDHYKVMRENAMEFLFILWKRILPLLCFFLLNF